MTIYTGIGDDGLTDLGDRRRIRKCDPHIEVVGAVDELNAFIGLALVAAGDNCQAEVREALEPLQGELMTIGAILATMGTDTKPRATLDESAVERTEGQIDRICAKLPKLKHFIIPGGCELGARLSVARAVCRRAERAVTRTSEGEKQVPAVILKYLNRLSDLLFVLGRAANKNLNHLDLSWLP